MSSGSWRPDSGAGYAECFQKDPVQQREWPSTDGESVAFVFWELRVTPHGWRFKADQQHIDMVPDAYRWWWQCPDCRRRCGVLFLIPITRRFTCRQCGGVAYSSRLVLSPGRVLRIDWPNRDCATTAKSAKNQ